MTADILQQYLANPIAMHRTFFGREGGIHLCTNSIVWARFEVFSTYLCAVWAFLGFSYTKNFGKNVPVAIFFGMVDFITIYNL